MMAMQASLLSTLTPSSSDPLCTLLHPWLKLPVAFFSGHALMQMALRPRTIWTYYCLEQVYGPSYALGQVYGHTVCHRPGTQKQETKGTSQKVKGLWSTVTMDEDAGKFCDYKSGDGDN